MRTVERRRGLGAVKLRDEKVYKLLKMLGELNVKPHMVYLVLRLHEDGNLHRGKELTDRGYDVMDVYSTIELLAEKGDLARFRKQTQLTEKGRRDLKFIEEIAGVAAKLVIS